MAVFRVLKKVTPTMSEKKEGDIVFKDKNGRIYLVDKNETITLDSLTLNTPHLVWVTCEKEKYGFIRLTVNGTLIHNYIRNGIGALDVDKLKDIQSTMRRTDSHYLMMTVVNSDIRFKKELDKLSVEKIYKDLIFNINRDRFTDYEYISLKLYVDKYLKLSLQQFIDA